MKTPDCNPDVSAAFSPAPGSAKKVELRRMLRIGQPVRVSGLSRYVDGVTGIVAGMIEREVSSDPITADGYWTIITEDGLRRDFQRRYLRTGRAPSPNSADRTNPTSKAKLNPST